MLGLVQGTLKYSHLRSKDSFSQPTTSFFTHFHSFGSEIQSALVFTQVVTDYQYGV